MEYGKVIGIQKKDWLESRQRMDKRRIITEVSINTRKRI